MDSASIIKSVEAVTARWTKQRKQEERGRARTRRAALTDSRGPSIKYAAWQVMKEAYLKASDGGKLPASARQIYYAARNSIMDATGKSELNSQYFTQTILPEYMVSHPQETENWDVTYDARGHFAEPHTEVITPLGTLDVRGYLADVHDHVIKPLDARDIFPDRIRQFPTCGPEHRFSAVLFIEKEGFMPLFGAVKLAERYDIAIMSTKGMPVVACRYLADELCGVYAIPLLVLHDFDKAGFSIFGTLDGRNGLDEEHARYEYRHNFDVIDLGLRLADVEQYDLESEPVSYRSRPSWNLKQNGATPKEVEYLCDPHLYRAGRRVELNAFTSPDFIRWIEAKLKASGIEKVIPEAQTLEAAYRRAIQVEVMGQDLRAIVEKGKQAAAAAVVPRGFAATVRKALEADPAQPWDQAVAAVAAANCKKRENGKTSEQAKSAAPNDGTFTKPAKRRRGQTHKTDTVRRPSLAETGISEELAAQCRAVASAPEGAHERCAEQVRQRDGQMTTEGYLRFVKNEHRKGRDSACTEPAKANAA